MNSMNRIVHEMKAANWGVIFSKLVVAVVVTFKFEYALFLYVIQKKQYSQVTIFDDDKWAKAQIYSIALIFRLWSKKHYRSPSFQQDMKDNLQNVAIPGTGIPLSIFCCNSVVCLAFIVIVNPIACLFSAVNKSRHNSEDFEQFAVQTLEYYVSHILHPDDWFSFWRLNCRLVSHHSSLKSTPGYLQEDKWTFLVSGRNSGVPVSPFMDIDSIVCKNKNIEGGMGIHFFKVKSLCDYFVFISSSTFSMHLLKSTHNPSTVAELFGLILSECSTRRGLDYTRETRQCSMAKKAVATQFPVINYARDHVFHLVSRGVPTSRHCHPSCQPHVFERRGWLCSTSDSDLAQQLRSEDSSQ